MTVTQSVSPDFSVNGEQPQQSLGTAAARNLATTTKSVPQMQEITSRWLLRLLPWVQARGGVFRVNRRLSYTVGSGRVAFVTTAGAVQVIPPSLAELPLLRGLDDEDTLEALAGRLVQREYSAGDVIVESGQPVQEGYLIAHGKVCTIGAGKYGTATTLRTLGDGDYFGEEMLRDGDQEWNVTVRAVTGCILLGLSAQSLGELMDQSDAFQAHITRLRAAPVLPQNDHGEAAIALASGHEGEPALPGTFVDYQLRPREYELSVAQTVLRVHSRVADLYNDPMNQVEQQLRLTIEALRERQEDELVNNRQFGLLANAEMSQRLQTHGGPPTPDDMDELLATVWKDPTFFLAHPRTIAAFGRECSRRGIYPQNVEMNGHSVPAWRGVPLFPCNKIPVTDTRSSSVLLLRAGEQNQGVIGLHQTGIPDEYEPGLNVRFMNVNEQGILSYLVSAYYSAAVLVPDALGVLENVEIGQAYE